VLRASLSATLGGSPASAYQLPGTGNASDQSPLSCAFPSSVLALPNGRLLVTCLDQSGGNPWSLLLFDPAPLSTSTLPPRPTLIPSTGDPYCWSQIVAGDFIYFSCSTQSIALASGLFRLPVSSLSLADPLSALQPAMSAALCSQPAALTFDPAAPNTLLVACGNLVYFLTDQFTCAPGEQFANGQCQQCAHGSYKATTITSGNTTTVPVPFPRCLPCPFNTEQPAPGLSTCAPCMLGYTSQGGTDVCTQCPRDSYTPSLSSGCVTCLGAGQAGLECRAGLASVSAGYFAYTAGDDSATPIYRTVRCPPGACVGGPLQLTASDSSAASITYCAWPRLNTPSNVMCGACVAGYVAWHGECVQCDGVNGGLVAALVIASLVLVVILVRLSASASASSGTALMLLIFFLQCCDVEMGPVSG
jgi:hypothetical protein